jgi:tRNA 2-thiouridine synthesizing protein E
MSTIEVNGKSYETDEEGYLVNLAEWNEDVGTYLAQTESVEMTDQHWEVITFLRDYYNEFQIAPAVRVLTKAIGKKLGPAPASTCTTCSPTVPPSRPARSPACRSRPAAYKGLAGKRLIGVGAGFAPPCAIRRRFFPLIFSLSADLDPSMS